MAIGKDAPATTEPQLGRDGPSVQVYDYEELLGSKDAQDVFRNRNKGTEGSREDAKFESSFSKDVKEGVIDVINRAYGRKQMDESGHLAPPEVAPEKHLAELKKLLPNSSNLGEDIKKAITESKLDAIASIAKQQSGNASIDAMFSVYRYLSDQLPTPKTDGIIEGRQHGKAEADKAREANPKLTDEEYKKIWMTEGLKRESSYEASGMMRYLAYPEMTPTEQVLSSMLAHGAEVFGTKEDAKSVLMNTLDIPSEEALDKQLSAAFSGLARKELFLPPNASYEDILKAREALFGTAPVDKDKMLAEYNKYFQKDLKSLNQLEDEINKDGIAQLKKLFGAFPIDK